MNLTRTQRWIRKERSRTFSDKIKAIGEKRKTFFAAPCIFASLHVLLLLGGGVGADRCNPENKLLPPPPPVTSVVQSLKRDEDNLSEEKRDAFSHNGQPGEMSLSCDTVQLLSRPRPSSVRPSVRLRCIYAPSFVR